MAFSTGTNIKTNDGDMGTIVDIHGTDYTVAIKNGAGEMTGLKIFHSEEELKQAGWTEA